MAERALAPLGLCGVELRGPLVLASGGLGETEEALRPFLGPSLGAVTTRTLRLQNFEERRVFPVPHLHLDARRRYVLNCEWGNQSGLSAWIEGGFERLARSGTPVIASVSGRSLADCAAVVSALPPDLVDLVEINVSCSHSGATFGRVEADAVHVAEVTEAAAAAFPRPPIVKLGWSDHVAEIAEVAVGAGAGAIAVTNTIGPGLDLDLESGRPVLGLAGGYGGISGPAIFPLALRAVAEVAGRVSVPVLGIGGVSSWREAAKMVLVGASFVGIYTAAMLRGPGVFDAVADGLSRWVAQEGAASVDELRGRALDRLPRVTQFAAQVPVVDSERCVPCPACRTICPADAITVTSIATIDAELCTSCGACVGACPPRRGAIGLPRPAPS